MMIADLRLPMPLDDLREILKAHGVAKASIFGSYARRQATAESDLDILVEYRSNVSLFDHLDLEAELVERTGRRVDLVSTRSVSKYLQPYIDRDNVAIL